MPLNMTNFKTLGENRHNISKPEQKKRQALYQYDIGAIRRIVRSMINDSNIECPQVISCIQAIPGYAPFTSLNVDAGGNLVFGPDNDAQTLVIDCDTNELSISNGNTVDLSCLWLNGTYLNIVDIISDYDIGIDLTSSVPLIQQGKSHIFLEVDLSSNNIVISNLSSAPIWVKDGQQVSFTITNNAGNVLTVNSLYGNVLFESIGDVCTLTRSTSNGRLVS